MKFKCDKCGKPATVHLTEIEEGQKIEKHLCDECAAADGFTVKANVQISELLQQFILQAEPAGSAKQPADLKCDYCGMTFSEFRNGGLLGCPHDYDAFEPALVPLLERAQESSSQHLGKVPRRVGSDQRRNNEILRLRAQLKSAIASEDYETAARLRDQIKELEN